MEDLDEDKENKVTIPTNTKKDTETLLLSSFESKQAQALLELQENMQTQLNALQQTKEKEKNNEMDERLQATLGELEVLRNALQKEKEKNSVNVDPVLSTIDKKNKKLMSLNVVTSKTQQDKTKKTPTSTNLGDEWQDILEKLKSHQRNFIIT
jgi:hypothetical protein